ncbi:amino acid adenylation domain-containing protein [Amycolatopsis sp. NPDC049159]|uniref:amino acid adenylation domain-containing protein n=1 Tax=Amycolatopsis sp. NPDC049159 TaxID=3157210 RepID=UPI0033C00D05
MTTLHEVVLARAAETPDAVAVTAGPVTLSYRELAGRARGLGTRLRAAGVGPERLVGVVVDRPVDALVAFLGVLIAGGGYVPLAASLPAERLREIAADAALTAVTGAREPAAAIPAPFVPVDGPERDEPPAPANPGQVAYVIHTSGSTGRPKGVVVTHAAAVRSTGARFTVYPHERMVYLVTAPLTIDAAVAGLYFTLFAGGRVVLPSPAEQADPGLLAELVARERVTHFDGLPSQYAMLLEFHASDLRGLCCVVLGGESLPYRLLRRHLDELPDVPLFNEFGPTEATVWCTVHHCTGRDREPRVPIGTAVPGMRATVLTGDLTPAPVGTVGEIYVGGPGLARGYLGRPAQTAERFVADPAVPGERMYRTGDLGALDANGEIVFHGRSDHMVKVRGFRVELGEVEARVLEHPGVAAAVVVPHASPTGTRLVAVVAFVPGRSASSAELAGFVGDRLPRHMVPAVWRRLEALPLTTAGKVDRRVLAGSAIGTGSALPR